MNAAPRRGRCERETRETRVRVVWVLDGEGRAEVKTGIGFFDHMLDNLARHGRFDLQIECEGDLHVDEHHTIEDVGLAMGRALAEAVGDKRGLRRMGDATVPLDEALALVAVDFSGRGQAFVDVPLTYSHTGGFRNEMLAHFLHSLASEARLTLHARLLAGSNDHHKIEAVFKALARALDEATAIDPRLGHSVPSTKGVL